MHFVAMAEYGRAMKNATPEHFWALGLHVRRAAPFPPLHNPAQTLSAVMVVWTTGMRQPHQYRRNVMTETQPQETDAAVPARWNIAAMACLMPTVPISRAALPMMKPAMTEAAAIRRVPAP